MPLEFWWHWLISEINFKKNGELYKLAVFFDAEFAIPRHDVNKP